MGVVCSASAGLSIGETFMRMLFFPWLWYRRRELQRVLAGKTVLITGASHGIGECLAYELKDSGARLLLVARTVDKLRQVQREVEDHGGQAEVFPCDLTDRGAVADLVATLCQRPGGIDVVVSNAGKSIRRSLFDSLDRLHDATRTIDLNYLGPVQILLGLVPQLVARQGQVINISAVNVLLAAPPLWGAYQASKTAFDQWFRCVGPELNSRGVATTSIYLPLVRTRMIQPTSHYEHVPAMRPQHVARLICRAIISRRRTYGPWWLLPAEIASTLLRWPWEVVQTWLCARRGRH